MFSGSLAIIGWSASHGLAISAPPRSRSPVIPRFSLARPSSLRRGIRRLRDRPGDAAYLAGGTELLQVMKMGFAQFAILVDLKRIEDLRGSRSTTGLTAGCASVPVRPIEMSSGPRPSVARSPALAALAARIANVRVRNTGTIGGNLAFAEPHSDPATFLLACGAIRRARRARRAGANSPSASSSSARCSRPLSPARSSSRSTSRRQRPERAGPTRRSHSSSGPRHPWRWP